MVAKVVDQWKLVEALMRQGHELIEIGEYAKAIKVGRRLRQLRYSGGFEILAMAYHKKDDIDKAVRVLKQGVRKAPNVWLLWQLLGNYLSDEGQNAEASRAYDKALKCPGANLDSINLNIAINLSRQGKRSKALRLCDSLEGSDWSIQARAFSLKTQLLVEQKNYDRAIRLGRRILRRMARKRRANEDSVASSICASVAMAYWNGKRKRSLSLEYIQRALEFDRTNADAMWLLREVNAKKSKKAQYFRVLAHGRWDGLMSNGRRYRPNFYTSYDLIAESTEEALKLIREFERSGIRNSLEIEEYKSLEGRPNDPKGIYAVTNLALYAPTRHQKSRRK